MNLPKDTVVLITGAGAGIGRAAALRFAESGARVVVTGRRPEPLKALAAGRENISSVLADAGNPDDARRTVETVIERWGRLDILVNNAGGFRPLSVGNRSASPSERIGR